jgi:hypothetical protein
MADSRDVGGSLLRGLSAGLKTYAGAKRAEGEQKRRTAEEWAKTQEKFEGLWRQWDYEAAAYRNQGTEEGIHTADQMENISADVDRSKAPPPDSKKLIPIWQGGFENEGQEFERILQELVGPGTDDRGSQYDLTGFAEEEGFGPGSLKTAGGERAATGALMPYVKMLDQQGRLGPLQREGALGPMQVPMAMDEMSRRKEQQALADLTGEKLREKAATLAVEGPELGPKAKGTEAGHEALAKKQTIAAGMLVPGLPWTKKEVANMWRKVTQEREENAWLMKYLEIEPTPDMTYNDFVNELRAKFGAEETPSLSEDEEAELDALLKKGGF